MRKAMAGYAPHLLYKENQMVLKKDAVCIGLIAIVGIAAHGILCWASDMDVVVMTAFHTGVTAIVAIGYGRFRA